MPTHSNLIVIGAGPGGYETALAAARRQMSVTLFNGDRLGGTCLNEGCIPTKCLCKNSEMVMQIREAEKFGIDEFTFTLDYNKVVSRKEEVISTLREGIAAMLKSAKVNVVESKARFKDARTVVDENGEEYTADNIIIATGSTSRSLPIPGADAEYVKNSTDILSIDYIPESLTIIGGGVIGMEFASIFAGFGTKVTVVEFMKQILPPFDSDIAKRLKQTLSKRGIEIITSAAAKEIRQTEDYRIEVVYEVKGEEKSVVSTDLLMAVGRAPRVSDLGLENAGVTYSPKGIPVNDSMQTNVSHIYAIGDVNARMMLAHVASFQGERALNAIEGKSDEIRFNIVPSAVFTVPECGMAGMTEEEAKAAGISVKKGQSFFRANGKALALGEPEGLCKLLFNKDDNRLIGAHIMGVQAADLAQQCADLMNKDITLEGLREIIFGHPTVSEVILTAANSVK